MLTLLTTPKWTVDLESLIIGVVYTLGFSWRPYGAVAVRSHCVSQRPSRATTSRQSQYRAQTSA